MRDHNVRIVELERRQARLEAELREAEAASRFAVSKSREITTNVPKPRDCGTAGTSSILRWAQDFCFKVIFDTEPTLNSTGSQNVTKDTDALEAAIYALETSTRAPARIVTETDDPANKVSEHYFSQSVHWQDSDKPWQIMYAYGSFNASVIPEIDSEHLWKIGFAFACGWFGDPGATIEIDDDAETGTVSAANRFVPCVAPYYQGDDIGDWDDWIGWLTNANTEEGIIESTGVQAKPIGTSYPWQSVLTYRLTKFVDFAYYDASGGRRGWRRLAYHRDMFDDGDIRSPYLFTEGPEHGTTGAYQFPAFHQVANLTGPFTSGSFIDSPGSAEVYVSWGSTCELPVPPITDDEPADWEDFCAAITNSSTLWTKIPGLTVFADGTPITNAAGGTYSNPPELTFQFSPRLQDFLDDNPDVSVIVEYGVRCDPPPFEPELTSPVAISDGYTVTPPRNTTCSGTKNTIVTLDIKLTASPARNLFDEICCTPYGTHCSVTEIIADSLEYDIEPI